MPSTTHKRKGSDFAAPAVATIVDVSTTTTPTRSTTTVTTTTPTETSPPTPGALKNQWNNLQQRMQAFQATFQCIKQENKDGENVPDNSYDPLLVTLDRLLEQPSYLQNRIGDLSKQANAIKTELNSEFTRLQNEWKHKSQILGDQQERLTTLEGRRDALRGEVLCWKQTIQEERDNLQNYKASLLQAAIEEEQRKLQQKDFMAKLDFKIGLFANITGIKIDESNMDKAWSGTVVRTH